MTFPPLIIWAKALFFFEQLFPVVARTWLELKSDSFFLGQKFRFLVQKSVFCHTTPILVKKSFPFPTVGAPSASNSPSALSAQALRARARSARAGKLKSNQKEQGVSNQYFLATLRKDNENEFSSLVVVRTKIKEHLYKTNLQEVLFATAKSFCHFAVCAQLTLDANVNFIFFSMIL